MKILMIIIFMLFFPVQAQSLDPVSSALAIHGVVRGFDFIFGGKDDKTIVREALSGKSSHAGILKDAVFEFSFGKKSLVLGKDLVSGAKRHVIARFSGPVSVKIIRELQLAAKRGVGVMVLADARSALARADVLKTLGTAGILARFSNALPGTDFIGIDGDIIAFGTPGESLLVFRNAQNLAREYALEWKTAWDEASPGKK